MKRRALLGLAGASMASLAGCLAATEYTVTDAAVEESSPPLSLDVTIRDAAIEIEGPATLEFALTNESEGTLRVRNVGIWPLGVLELAPSTPETPQTLPSNTSQTPPLDPPQNQNGSQNEPQTGPKITLWNDRYEESEYVDTEGRGLGVPPTPVVRPLDAGETVSTTYQIRGDDFVQTGTYYLRAYGYPSLFTSGTPPLCFHAPPEMDDWTPYLPTVSVTIKERSVVPGL